MKERDAQWRLCRLDVAPLMEVDSWMSQYRTFFEMRLDKLAAQLQEGAQSPSRKEQQ